MFSANIFRSVRGLAHIIAPHVWLVGVSGALTTQTDGETPQKSRSFDPVRVSRCSSPVTPSHSLLSAEPSGTHGDTRLDTPLLRRSGLTARKCETEIRPHLSQCTFWSKSNKRSMSSSQPPRVPCVHAFVSKTQNENLKK